MRLRDMNWMDVASYLEHDDRIALVVGATEQHGYLSLLTDALIAERLADAIAAQDGLLVAPPLNIGVSDEFVAYPGTISLGRATFDALLTDVIDSLMHHGFRGFLVVNGHGGNHLPATVEALVAAGEIRLHWFNWWAGAAVAHFEAAHNLRLDHANWGENFAFCRVAQVPDGDKPPVDLALLDQGQDPRDVMGDGSFGGPYQIDDERMRHLFDAAVAEGVAHARALRR